MPAPAKWKDFDHGEVDLAEPEPSALLPPALRGLVKIGKQVCAVDQQ